MSSTAEKLAELRKKLEVAQEPAGEAGIAKRARKGLPSARDRINMLLDPGSFVETGALVKQPNDPNGLYGDGVVTGHGTVEGRPVAVFSHDQTVFGGSVGEMFGRKVAAIMEFANKIGCPCVGINDSGGARVQDAVTSLAWYAELGRRQEPLSGLVPQISMILGKCAGGAVYAPINTDILVATEDSYMFVTGPDVIREVTGEDVSLQELGGAHSQAELRQHQPHRGGREVGVRVGARVPLVPAVELPGTAAGGKPGPRTRDHRHRPGTERDHPRLGQRRLRHARDPAADLRRRRLPRDQRPGGAEHHHRLRPRGRSQRRRGRESASGNRQVRSTPPPPTRPRGSCASATRSRSR